ncbi:SMP-30/gluconolactonase/LRE family protein [Tranquillimonas alkanivorans]|uniref:Predicted lipoprotein with conserved Yx(FWY)xxD motif n=1 Tax=Tranquillimonas alkanivorans TaxID=441119 RepID=A0A1I5RSC2_9RHOB|nr:SMP-30/gluconolactonase/LRE family protein [Tranquillimonas alkanivorans]SFP61280.1 Predicted lipoprotein with conserved Yx(FWY)xxD motif [Tranquillimonas alkanivorans]
MTRTMLKVVVLLLTTATAADAQGLTIKTRISAQEGPYIVEGAGRTLYSFSADTRGKGEAKAESACTGPCTHAYPPVLAEEMPEIAEGADAGFLDTLERPDGSTQVTYYGWPLYRYTGDQGQGAAAAAGMSTFGGTWHRVPPEPDIQPPAHAGLFDGLDLQAPECVRYDEAHDRWLVSNINGEMLEGDDNGFITAVTGEGLAELKWIDGASEGITLNAPKGMQIAGDLLYVADIDHLRVFDLSTGQPVESIAIEGAKFLNGIAIAENGTVFVTDTGTDPASSAIHRVGPNGTATTIASGRHLQRPNGIDFGPQGNLVVATYAAAEVMLLSREGEMLQSRTLDRGQLDGLVVRSDASVLVSSWKGRHVARIGPDGEIEVLVTGLTQPACFDWEPDEQLLLIPQVKANAVAVVGLAGVEGVQ